jgi:hypothetical protein
MAIKKRKFNVWTSHNPDNKNQVFSYKVTDWLDGDENMHERDDKHKLYRPPIALFPVGNCWAKEEQEELAYKLCDYLNAVRKAEKTAVELDATLKALQI